MGRVRYGGDDGDDDGDDDVISYQEEYWPMFLSLVVVPTFIQLLLLPWFPESPRYLLIEKRNIHATITGEPDKTTPTWSPDLLPFTLNFLFLFLFI